MDRLTPDLGDSGRVWLRGALDGDALTLLEGHVDLANRPGARLGLTAELDRAIGPDSALGRKIAGLLPGARPVRVVGFDKSNDQNWGVPWHQDRIIAVNLRCDLPGYDNWSQKGAVWHCEPPDAILNQMLFVRLHLDACDGDNGAMEIALGSHAGGTVPARLAQSAAAHYETEVTRANRGDVLVLGMFTLHRSRPSQSSRARRTIRVDYAADILPDGLGWTNS